MTSAPSRDSLERLRDILVPGGRVGRVWRLRGGIAAWTHAVDLFERDGTRHRLAIRRYPPERLNDRHDRPQLGFRILSLLGELGLAAPRPVWVDPRGDIFDRPALVMTRLSGRGLMTPRDPVDWAEQLGRALAEIHRAPLAGRDIGFLPTDEGWLAGHLAGDKRPADHPEAAGLWDALAGLWPWVKQMTPTLVHGDYWAGNTLWRRQRLVGVVDWDGAWLAQPGMDVGYCRMDLAMLIGGDMPDVFQGAYERAMGRAVVDLPFWDLVGARFALTEYEKWAPGYADMGLVGLTPAIMGVRLRAFIADRMKAAGS